MCKRNEQPKWRQQALTKTICRHSVIPPESERDLCIIQIQEAIIAQQQATIAEQKAILAERKATIAELQATLERLQRVADQQQRRCIPQGPKMNTRRLRKMMDNFIRQRPRYTRHCLKKKVFHLCSKKFNNK